VASVRGQIIRLVAAPEDYADRKHTPTMTTAAILTNRLTFEQRTSKSHRNHILSRLTIDSCALSLNSNHASSKMDFSSAFSSSNIIFSPIVTLQLQTVIYYGTQYVQKCILTNRPAMQNVQEVNDSNIKMSQNYLALLHCCSFID